MTDTFPTRAQACRRGFSLVELLVVIGIIAILMALLFPVIGRARRQANATACLSNCGQLAQSYTVYLVDKKNRNPSFTFVKATTSWYVDFRTELGLPDRSYLCPSVSGSLSSDFGGASRSWTLALKNKDGALDRWTGSYGFNAWLLTWEPVGKGGDQFGGGPAVRHLTPVSLGSSMIPVFGDCTWSDAWPREDDPTPPNLSDGDRRHQGPERAPKENMMARFAIARHDERINIAFLDGHAETVTLDRLKRLRWHADFSYQDWQPALPKR